MSSGLDNPFGSAHPYQGESITEESMTQFNSLIIIVIGIAVAAGLFLLLREVVCWYLKISQIVSLLEKILEAVQKPESKDTGGPTKL
jgi:ABC-type uncharacterized transport system permease subunit